MILSKKKKKKKNVMFPNLCKSISLYLLILNHLALEFFLFLMSDLYNFVITWQNTAIGLVCGQRYI